MSFYAKHQPYLYLSEDESPVDGLFFGEKQAYLRLASGVNVTTGVLKHIGAGLEIFEIATMAYDNNKYYVLSGSFIEYDSVTGNIEYTGGETLDKLCVKVKYTKT